MTPPGPSSWASTTKKVARRFLRSLQASPGPIPPASALKCQWSQGHRRETQSFKGSAFQKTGQLPPRTASLPLLPFFSLQELQSSRASVHLSSTNPSRSSQQDEARHLVENTRSPLVQPDSIHTSDLAWAYQVHSCWCRGLGTSLGDMTHKQLLEIPSTKHYQGGVGRSGDREIDSCWGAGASSWM